MVSQEFMTVTEYAKSRNRDSSTVRKWIQGKGWELPASESDARSRVLNSEQMKELDADYKVSAKPVEKPVEVYERSEEVSKLIIEGELIDTQIQSAGLVRADDNPYISLVQQRLQQMQAQNQLALAQADQQVQANLDVQKAMQSLQDAEAIQAGVQDAIRLHNLRQSAKQQTLTNLSMKEAGLAPVAQVSDQQPSQQEVAEAAKKPSPEVQQWPI